MSASQNIDISGMVLHAAHSSAVPLSLEDMHVHDTALLCSITGLQKGTVHVCPELKDGRTLALVLLELPGILRIARCASWPCTARLPLYWQGWPEGHLLGTQGAKGA